MLTVIFYMVVSASGTDGAEGMVGLEEGQKVLRAEVQALRREMELRFKEMDRRMDERFRVIDERFKTMDERFEAINERFEEVNKRFEEVSREFGQIDRRFEQIDKRFEELGKRIDILGKIALAVVGAFAGIVAVTIGFAIWDRLTAVKPVSRKLEVVEDDVDKMKKVLVEVAQKDERTRKALEEAGLIRTEALRPA